MKLHILSIASAVLAISAGGAIAAPQPVPLGCMLLPGCECCHIQPKAAPPAPKLPPVDRDQVVPGCDIDPRSCRPF